MLQKRSLHKASFPQELLKARSVTFLTSDDGDVALGASGMSFGAAKHVMIGA